MAFMKRKAQGQDGIIIDLKNINGVWQVAGQYPGGKVFNEGGNHFFGAEEEEGERKFP